MEVTGDAGDAFPRIELRDPLGAPSADFIARLGVGEKAGDRVRKCGRIILFDQQAATGRLHNPGHATDTRGDHKRPGRKDLHQAHAEGFAK